MLPRVSKLVLGCLWKAGPVLAVVLAASSAGAAETPSLEAIRTRLEKQRQQVRSIYVELKYYTTTTVDPKLLVTWPPYRKLLFIHSEEDHFAFKGEKRYFRLLQPPEMKRLQPPKPPEVDPTAPAEVQESQRRSVQQYERAQKQMKEMERKGVKPPPQDPEVIKLAPDEARAVNGKIWWIRRLDRKEGRAAVTVGYYDRRRQWVNTPMYFSNIGWANTDPSTEDEQGREIARHHDLVDLLKAGQLGLVPETAQLDGATCVILERQSDKKVPAGKDMKREKVVTKFWLDLDHGSVLRQVESSVEGRLAARIANSEFVEILPGLWFPKKTAYQNFAPPEAPKEYQGKVVLTWHSDLTKWIVDQVPDDLFDLVTKPGDFVIDTRQTNLGK